LAVLTDLMGDESKRISMAAHARDIAYNDAAKRIIGLL
jgi:hypothetical protein